MKSFEEISKMNLAELDRPDGAGEEELETETTGAAGDSSVRSEVEATGNAGADDSETSEYMMAESSDSEDAKQAEELEKKVMMEPQGKHFFIDAEITQQELNTFLFGHTYRQPLMILVTILAIAWPIAVIVKGQSNIAMPVICSLFILIWIPFTTYLRAKNAKKLNPLYEKPFHYMLDEWGLHLEIEDDAIDVEWKKVTKMIFYKSVAVIYTGKNNAFLIPSAAMGARKEEIMSFIEEMRNR
nr:hypothetical protein [uncultured Anaerobutyricum sp.]